MQRESRVAFESRLLALREDLRAHGTTLQMVDAVNAALEEAFGQTA